MSDLVSEGAGLNHALAGRYTLVSPIGQGGMGTVWRARDELLDRDVAVKEVLVHAGLSDHDRAVLHERTMREAKATARLSHPGIVTIHDVVEEDGRPWIVMELVPARSLQEILDAEGPLPYAQAVKIGRQMLNALRTAHAAGILHRDIKPANVLLLREDPEPRAVLTDFGLAQITGDVSLTQTGLVMGSPAYIAPERVRGEKAATAADLWALGATLYAATEGRPPHDRSDSMAALAAVLTIDPEPPRNAGPLTPVIMGLLEREPAARLTGEAAANLLAQIGSGPPTGALARPQPARTQPAPPPLEPPAKRPQWTWAVIAGVAVIAVGGGLVGSHYLNSKHDPQGNPAPSRRAAQGPLPSATSATELMATPKHTIPAGLLRVSGLGYTIEAPVGWKPDQRGISTFWRDPGSPAYVQIDRIPWTGTPIDHWRAWQGEVIKKQSLKNFSPLGIRPAPGTGFQAADDEFTFSAKGVTMHAIDRGVLTHNGQHYAVLVTFPEPQWAASRGKVEEILASFRPQG
jgi:serine/threonine protein kinase